MTAILRLYSGEEALIDEADLELTAPYRWLADRREFTTYAYAHVKIEPGVWRNLKLHRLIMNAPAGVEVDHRNLDGLDNQRGNLRIGSSSQNKANVGLRSNNRSGYKGVRWRGDINKWAAEITVNRKARYLGVFVNAWEAALAYDAAAFEAWGDCALLNSSTLSRRSGRASSPAQPQDQE